MPNQLQKLKSNINHSTTNALIKYQNYELTMAINYRTEQQVLQWNYLFWSNSFIQQRRSVIQNISLDVHSINTTPT